MKNYSKNPYYTDMDIKKAKELAKRFYAKEYSPVLLRAGNLKLGSNVLIWDLPSIITCKYRCKDCYALKAERMYKNTRVMRAFHYEIIKQALRDNEKYKYLHDYITIELKHHALLYKEPVVRIHSSGDFFSDVYFNFWFILASENKDINFYAYTKAYSNEFIDKVNGSLSNFNIVKSLINDKYINFGDLDYLEDVTKILETEEKEYHICGYGHSDNKLQCMGNCKHCLHCSNILFIKH